jgi:hypothetical protein
MERADSGSSPSTRVHNAAVEKRLAAITAQDSQRNSPMKFAPKRSARFNLPAWPTTTIGSFPQTTEIRGLRLDFKKAIWMRTTIAPASRTHQAGDCRAGAFRAGRAGAR